MSSSPKIILYGKQGLEVGEVGDCPYAQRVNLTLRLKKLPFEFVGVNLQDKPTWFLEMYPKGTVPVLKYGDQEPLGDSDEICLMLERLHPEPKLYPEDKEKLKIGGGAFGAFAAYFKNKEAKKSEELLEKFKSELQGVEDHFRAGEGKLKFALGEEISALDAIIGLRLRIARLVLEHFKNWNFAKEERFKLVGEYLERLEAVEEVKLSGFRLEVAWHYWAKFL